MLEWQLGTWCLVFQNCLFRRSILERAGEYRTDLMPTEDSEYLVRILMSGARPAYTPECIVFYRTESEGQSQITISGTKDEHRANDQSHYLEIIADLVEEEIPYFHPSTLREIALNIKKHNHYCRKMGWLGVRADSPFNRLVASVPPFYLKAYEASHLINRKLYKLSPMTPLSQGLKVRPISEQEEKMANNAGLAIQPRKQNL